MGPNNWPGPHADTTKLIASTASIEIFRIVFMNFLRYYGRTRRLLKVSRKTLNGFINANGWFQRTGCHAHQPTKRTMFFERKRAA
jgi:hypothetical protein